MHAFLLIGRTSIAFVVPTYPCPGPDFTAAICSGRMTDVRGMRARLIRPKRALKDRNTVNRSLSHGNCPLAPNYSSLPIGHCSPSSRASLPTDRRPTLARAPSDIRGERLADASGPLRASTRFAFEIEPYGRPWTNIIVAVARSEFVRSIWSGVMISSIYLAV
jgi:hypothetical protein